MKIVYRSDLPMAQPTRIECTFCGSTLDVEPADWVKGTYGSEMVCKCPICARQLVKPGTEYTGDF